MPSFLRTFKNQLLVQHTPEPLLEQPHFEDEIERRLNSPYETVQHMCSGEDGETKHRGSSKQYGDEQHEIGVVDPFTILG